MLEKPTMEANPLYPSQQLFPTPMEQSTLKIYKNQNWLQSEEMEGERLFPRSPVTHIFFCFFFTFPNFQTIASEGRGEGEVGGLETKTRR